MSFVSFIHPLDAAATCEVAEAGEALTEEPLDEESDSCLIELVAPEGDRRDARTTRENSWVVAFLIAVAVHGALIALGFLAVRFATRVEEPRLILPKGWATEFDGSGNAGQASVAELRPVSITALAAVTPRMVESQPPSYEPPAVTLPPVVIDEAYGTNESEPLTGFSQNVEAPVNRRSAPVGSSAAAERTGVSNEATPETRGTAASGTGDGSGGGTQGVPEGMPVPSIRNKIPTYPAEALRKGWTGTVKLELTISATGEVTSARIVQSSNYDLLDQSALETARTWLFAPARLNGRPIALTVIRPVNFEQPRSGNRL